MYSMAFKAKVSITESKFGVDSSGLCPVHLIHIRIVLIDVEYRNCRMFIYFLLFGWGKFNQN